MFWRENTVYPFTHYLVPLALYLSSRSLFFSLFTIYLWESIETLIGQFINATYQEPWYDRMIGDPLQGGLAITTAWLADVAFCWHAPVVGAVSGWTRLFFFVVIFAGQGLLVGPRRPWLGVLLFGAMYVITLFIFFWSTGHSVAEVRESVSVTATVVAVQTIVVSLPLPDGPSYLQSRFSRSFITSLLTLAVLGVMAGVYGNATEC